MAKENGNGAPPPDGKTLWGAFMKAYKAYSAAQVAQSKAQDDQSAAAGAILKAMGSGPYKVPGLGVVTIVMRQRKDDEGTPIGDPTFFIKRLGDTEIQNIEL